MGLIDGSAEAAPDFFDLVGLDGKPVRMTADELAGLDHASLYQLRERNQDNPALQTVLAPLEHRAFAREATKENPLMAVPIALATPIYAAGKGLGLINGSRSGGGNPLGQIGAGFTGVAEGLAGAARRAAGL